ncbi:MAG: response regulator [Myxococcota bacterium]
MRSYAILLVEDNADDVKQTLRAFARNNIANHVVVARDGAEALDYLFAEGRSSDRDSSIQPGLVLLDLKLPRVTGLQVLARIRADDRTRHLPVVILTSSSEAQDVAAGYAAGANNYLRKPVHFASFLQAARSVGLFWTLVESGLALLHQEAPDATLGAQPAEPDPSQSSRTNEVLQPRPLQVLVGKSDVDACARLAEVLEGDGHVVHRAHGARGVFGRLLTALPDALVVDADLPEIGGADVVRVLRDTPHGRGVTSVVLTADRAGSRPRLDPAVHLLDKTQDTHAVVALMRRMRFDVLLRDLAAEREQLQPPAAHAETTRGAHRPVSGRAPSPADPWALLELPADASSAVVAHAVQTLTNALDELAAQATSARVRTYASALAARLRQAARELVEPVPPTRR